MTTQPELPMVKILYPRDWVCPACGIVNYKGKRCGICDEDKPKYDKNQNWSDVHQLPDCVMDLIDKNYVATRKRWQI